LVVKTEESKSEVKIEDVIKTLEKALEEIETGIAEKSFPEVYRSYVQGLGRSIRETLKVLKIMAEPDAIQTPLSASGRGAMYNLRRAFYARLSRLTKEENVDKDRSTSEWRNAAQKLIEYMNSEGLSETPCKIVLKYEIVEENETKYLKPVKATVLYFELEGIKEVTL